MTVIAEETTALGKTLKERGKGLVWIGRCTERKSKVRDFSYQYPEPALELRMKIRRIAALKRIERVKRFINQGGTAGYPVPRGIGCPAFILLWERACNTKA